MAVLATALGLLLPAAALAAPPTITQTTSSGATETSISLRALIDPNGVNVKDAHFDYLPLETYEADGDSFAADTLSSPSANVPPSVKGAGSLQAGSDTVTGVATTTGTFAAGQSITATATAIPSGTTIAAVQEEEGGTGLLRLTLSQQATATASPASLKATGPQPLAAELEGLSPATAYRFRAVAVNNGSETAIGPTATFFTRAAAPTFGPCPNDAFRSGQLAPLGQPSAALPDCRAYERASPLDKDGGDVLGAPGLVKAAAQGAAITFGSAFDVPGGLGAQAFPFFLASRGGGEAGWSTQGVLPPAATGEKAIFLRGWLPDFSQTFATAKRLGAGVSDAFFELHSDGAPPTQITPYQPVASESAEEGFGAFAGASADGQTVVFEAEAALPARASGGEPLPGSLPGASNVYAWDARSGEVHLASVMNRPEETAAALPKGAFAGPYDFASKNTKTGGAASSYYTIEPHAVAEDGSTFFTAAGSGQLYERLHPTQPQSAVIHAGEPDEECTEAAKACTIHVSAGHRAPPDPAGSAPAAFQAAGADGSQAFFTSSEKLTADANTGPDQPAASIGRGNLSSGAIEDADFLPAHALGVAVDPAGEYIYWADPSKGSIGRARLSEPHEEEDEFIVPGETEFETRPISEPGVIHSGPARPRYVTLGPCAEGGECVYWTNTGPLGEGEVRGATDKPVLGAGTIGRASLDPSGQVEVIDPEWITGASDPQGIAVNASHVYWANAPQRDLSRAIARAQIDGGEVEQLFQPTGRQIPQDVALNASDVYFTSNDNNNNSSVERIPLEGGEEEFTFIGKVNLRGIALDSTYLYWAAQGEEAIGRLPLADFPELGPCTNVPTCEKNFTAVEGHLFGLASDASHLYWSVNGEASLNPGNDLYRFRAPGAGGCTEAKGCLEDLTADPEGNGAEVQGLLGASADASYLYFTANGVLTAAPNARGEVAEAGDCKGFSSGSCSLYLLHDGQLSFIARLNASGGGRGDQLNWVPTPFGLLSSGFSQKTASVAPDGTLLFRSVEQLSEYESRGIAELYRYRPGAEIGCVSCNPSGAAPSDMPTLFNASFAFTNPRGGAAATLPRSLAAGGRRVFFQSTEALVSADTNGAAGCPRVGGASLPACQDVYEWEAPGTGSCSAPGPGYSPLNGGCIYLISTGKSNEPSFFADASESGEDAFIFTRQPLVGADTDNLQDVYDARTLGGLAAQNPLPGSPCEAEACKPAASAPPSFTAPPHFSEPPNPKPRTPRCKRGKVLRHGLCAKAKRHRHHRHHHKKGGSK